MTTKNQQPDDGLNFARGALNAIPVLLLLWLVIGLVLLSVCGRAHAQESFQPDNPNSPARPFKNSQGENCVEYRDHSVRCVSKDPEETPPFLRPTPLNRWQHFTRSKWEGALVIGMVAGAVLADNLSTSRALGRCPGCVEQSPLYGKHPSNRRIALTGLGIAAGESALVFFSRRFEREAGLDGFHLIPAGAFIIAHSFAASSNTRVNGSAPTATPHLCPAGSHLCER